MAEALAAESPEPALRDGVAEAHFAMAVSNLRAGDFRAMLAHFAEQLRIKLEIGKLGGAAASLLNLGFATEHIAPDWSAPLFLTADQISRERQLPMPAAAIKSVEEAAARLVSDADKRELARTVIGNLSAELLPFYERSLKRCEEISCTAPPRA